MQTASMKKKTSDEITKTTFKKLWGWLTYPDWTRRKHPLAKNLPLSANWWGDISTVMLWWLHINPSKTGLDRKRYNPISPPIYTNRMIFGKGVFPSCSKVLNKLTNLIIEQIWIFVMSLFLTLYYTVTIKLLLSVKLTRDVLSASRCGMTTLAHASVKS